MVDDDAAIRRALKILLRSHGHSVTAFESGEECLAGRVAAECAIVDVALTGISGLELHERLRETGRLPPVVFVTARPNPSVVAAARRLRQPLLSKPVDEEELLGAIARAVGGRE